MVHDYLYSKYNNSHHTPVQDGIILKLNKLNARDAAHMMAVTPSPEDMLDAPDTNHVTGSNEEGQGNVFCCDPLSISKRHHHPEGRKSSRRRRGPGQAVQVLFDHQQPSEVRHSSIKESGKSHSLSVISSAPQLNNTPQPPPPLTAIISTPASSAEKTAKASKGSTKLTRHSSLRQPSGENKLSTLIAPGSSTDALASSMKQLDEGDPRNYDDMIKFILTEHGIKVISEKEFVV